MGIIMFKKKRFDKVENIEIEEMKKAIQEFREEFSVLNHRNIYRDSNLKDNEQKLERLEEKIDFLIKVFGQVRYVAPVEVSIKGAAGE